jgi:SAM-dependent methyltransferase
MVAGAVARTAGSPATELYCPAGHGQLEDNGDQVRCPTCELRFPVVRGVVRSLDETDTFYEGTYLNHVRYVPRSERPWHAWPLWLITNGFLWAVRRHVAERAIVVELGCAGGVSYFGRRYRMIGVDVSGASLEVAGAIYDRCIQADASSPLPLREGNADAVISSYFWEHIAPEKKEAILAECRRILRPGGKLIFLFDVKTMNPLISRLRKADRKRYDQEFIEKDGHIGYQTPDENASLLASAGFTIVEMRGYERGWLQSGSVYEKMSRWPGVAGVAGRVLRAAGHRLLFIPYTILLRVLDETLGRLRPLENSRILLVVAERASV